MELMQIRPAAILFYNLKWLTYLGKSIRNLAVKSSFLKLFFFWNLFLFFSITFADLAGVELAKNINTASQNESIKINASLSQFRSIFKSLVTDNASKTPHFINTRDGLLPGLMRQFNNMAKIISIFCLCPAIEFSQENSSVLDFCNLT